MAANFWGGWGVACVIAPGVMGGNLGLNQRYDAPLGFDVARNAGGKSTSGEELIIFPFVGMKERG